MRAFVLLLAVLASGCTARDAFITLHTMDTVQTVRGPALTSGCYEIDPITSRLIGDKPSTAEVLAWSLGTYLVWSWVRSKLPARWVPAFDWTSVAFKGVVVANNYRNGIPLTGHVECN